MTPEQFRLSLILERFGQPVPEWRPTVDDLIAAAERVEFMASLRNEEEAA